MKRKLITCECEALNHILVLTPFKEDREFKTLFVEMYLKPIYGFRRRLRLAFRYLFKLENKFESHFEEVVLSKEKVEEFRDFLNDFLNEESDET